MSTAIKEKVNQIMEARRGEEVRGSIADSIDLMDDSVDSHTANYINAGNAATSANNAASSANTAADRANSAADLATSLSGTINGKLDKMPEEDVDTISDNLGGLSDTSLGNILKEITKTEDVALSFYGSFDGTYTCKAYPALRICIAKIYIPSPGNPGLASNNAKRIMTIPSKYKSVVQFIGAGKTGSINPCEVWTDDTAIRAQSKVGNISGAWEMHFTLVWMY